MSILPITGLYYITAIDNLPSILQQGILSHNQIKLKQLQPKTIYDETVVQRRLNRQIPSEYISGTRLTLGDYVNLYFQPRNPMLYRLIVGEKRLSELVVLKLRKQILELPNVLVTDGNAAHANSQILLLQKAVLQTIQKQIDVDYWKEIDGSKRKIMAECLVPNQVPTDYLECIYVGQQNGMLERVKEIIQATKKFASLNVIVESNLFFQPKQRIRLTDCLSLATGDLFFSRMQTLTISVNTMGVMGKGLASRAKYQFPEVYVRYQDLCRDKKLRTDLPALVKTEMSLLSELSEISTLDAPANWFLLFATKQNWRQNSKIDYIINGLSWLEQHYKEEGITSLALPALGCGLGHLQWETVGPILCNKLRNFDIPVCIYLPTEKKIASEYLSATYLLDSPP